MSIRRAPFLPQLWNNIFAEIENTPDTYQESTHKFYNKLYPLCGNVLKAALELLDQDISITIYTTENEAFKIAELVIGRNSKTVIRFQPNSNFCPCDKFQREIVEYTKDLCTEENRDYTCEHVLAVRLARLLHYPGLCTVKLSPEKFNIFATQMLRESFDL